MPVQTITTRGGARLVVLGEDQYEDLIDARDAEAAPAKAARIREADLAQIESGDKAPDVATLARLARQRVRIAGLIPAADDDTA
jgi:hypothetical protein